MAALRTQLSCLANLVQTVLQYRISPSEALREYLAAMRKKISQAIYSQSFESSILDIKFTKENYQVKNKILKYLGQATDYQNKEIFIQVYLKAIQKSTCQIYNEQLWEFNISNKVQNRSAKKEESSVGLAQIIQSTLKYLHCYTLQPLNKHQRNRYMIDHKIVISAKQNQLVAKNYQSISFREILLEGCNQRAYSSRIQCKYYFNEFKMQQSLKQAIMYQSLNSSCISKKNSSDSTDSTRRVSIYQYYDNQLDITVLSGSDENQMQNGEEIEVHLENDLFQEQFQMLIEENVSDDERFLSQNLLMFRQLNHKLIDYF